MIKNLKLKNRLLLSFSVILIFTILISFLALTGLKKSNTDLNYFIYYPMAADSAVNTCHIEANVAARTLRDMLIDTNSQNISTYKNRIQLNITNINENLKKFESSYSKQDGLVSKYKTALNNWITVANQIISTIESGDREKAKTMILNECTPALQELLDISKELDTTTGDMKDAALKASQRDTNMSSLIVIALLIASIALSVLISIKVTISIVKPIDEVKNAAIEMSKGNLNTPITNNSTDEVGQLAESMRCSMRTISEYINDIDISMAEMAKGNFTVKPSRMFIGDFKNIETSISNFVLNMTKALHFIQHSSGTVEDAAGQVSSSSQALAQGATEQASEIDTLSASVEEIAVKIKANAENCNVANNLANSASSEVVSGDEKMQHLIAAMGDISNSSKEIEKIIKTIEDIAFQTNILALNAAVEAARAGSAGKGFAVVADEVRNLAAKSAEAAKNTTQLIQSSIKAVSNGAQLADDTAKTMAAVVMGASQIKELILEISVASNEQAEASEQITSGLNQIANVIQTNSATAEESAAASEELSGQSKALKGLVAEFKLEDLGDINEWDEVKQL